MPGTLKQPLLYLNRMIGHSSAKNHITKLHMGNTDALEHDSDSDKKHLKSVYEKRAKRQSAQEERKSIQAKRRQEEEAARAA
ncbi:hypothetical protein F4803DRAFT_499006, partial [Xylaria telfairii]